MSITPQDHRKVLEAATNKASKYWKKPYDRLRPLFAIVKKHQKQHLFRLNNTQRKAQQRKTRHLIMDVVLSPEFNPLREKHYAPAFKP